MTTANDVMAEANLCSLKTKSASLGSPMATVAMHCTRTDSTTANAVRSSQDVAGSTIIDDVAQRAIATIVHGREITP